jgi:K+-transporting ATPase KdpF subunit
MSDFDDGSDLRSRGGRLFRPFVEADSGEWEDPVNPLYLIGGLVAAGLLVYLFVALLKPENFS